MYVCEKCSYKGGTPEHASCLELAPYRGDPIPTEITNEVGKMTKAVLSNSAYRMVITNRIDPADLAVLFAKVFRNSGMRTRFRVVSEHPDKDPHHVILEFLLPGTGHKVPEVWLPVDPLQCRSQWVKSLVMKID